MSCRVCAKDAVFRCSVCGSLMCPGHTRFRTVCVSCMSRAPIEYAVEKVRRVKERRKIQELVRRFWGEEEQLTFGRRFTVAELPAYVSKDKDKIVGFTSYADTDDTLIIVALGVLPEYQGLGIGKSLIEKIEKEGSRLKKKKLLVSTSNDDLPALAFYQSLGFQIFEVEPNVIAEKHGAILSGIGGLPVRDELRLQKKLRLSP